MAEHRYPLSSLPTNTPFPATPAAPAPKKLAPIFTAYSSRTTSTPSLSQTHSSPSASSPTQGTCSSEAPPTPTRDVATRKRVRLATAGASDVLEPRRHGDEDDSARIHNYFAATSCHGDGHAFERAKEVRILESMSTRWQGRGEWRRARRRLGMGMSSAMFGLVKPRMRMIHQEPCQLDNYVTSLCGGMSPTDLPSTILLPSLHSLTGQPRDFAPGVSVAFSNTAKRHDARSAREQGARRMVAIAGEEGGIRVLDVDDGMGHHPEERGWWWRAHTSAVFDVRWSSDDSHILTASGDQTSRIHSLTSPTPTLIATLRGHTSSIKTAVFFDPSRTHSDASSSSIVASAGRDGNILIFDLRCRGRQLRDSAVPPRRSVRYATGVPGWAPQADGQVLDPVMSIRNAHGDTSRRSAGSRSVLKSVTSLVALQAMPGMLASGGNSNGIVKLWDLRFPEATARSPTPHPSCTAYGVLPDPTIRAGRSSRPRSLNAMAECPLTGDLYVACGDSRIHTLRPSASSATSDPHEYPTATSSSSSTSETEDSVSATGAGTDAGWSLTTGQAPGSEAIQPRVFADPEFLVRTFYIRLAVSPDGRYLACGNGRDGIMTFDTADGRGVKLGLGDGGNGREREVSAVDWGKDLLAACADDMATRVYRPNEEARRWMTRDPYRAGQEWAGAPV